MQLIMRLILLLMCGAAYAWSNQQPALPVAPQPSAEQLQSTAPVNLLQNSSQSQDLPSVKYMKAWVLPVSQPMSVEAANTTLQQLQKQGYPVYMSIDNNQAMVYVGPEADQARLEKMKEKLSQTMVVGVIQAFNPLQLTKGMSS